MEAAVVPRPPEGVEKERAPLLGLELAEEPEDATSRLDFLGAPYGSNQMSRQDQ